MSIGLICFSSCDSASTLTDEEDTSTLSSSIIMTSSNSSSVSEDENSESSSSKDSGETQNEPATTESSENTHENTHASSSRNSSQTSSVDEGIIPPSSESNEDTHSSSSKESSQTSSTVQDDESSVSESIADTPIARHGKLQVCDKSLCDKNGEVVQLKGMSSHGIQWFGLGNCLTDGSLDALAYDWNADILRIATYVQEGGYETDPEKFTNDVHELIEMATERGMYALVDWHQLTPGDPNYNTDLAKQFFTDIATRHKDKTNIIYDIANEPNNVSWSLIRDYALELMPVIRAIDPDAVIFVGTAGWGTFGHTDGDSPWDVIDNPIDIDNIMYTFHFYAASPSGDDAKEAYREALRTAATHLPVFVTEFGTQESTGGGPNDFDSAEEWMTLLNDLNIGWTNWNFGDSQGSSDVWKEGHCQNGNQNDWSSNNLKEAGKWIRDKMRED